MADGVHLSLNERTAPVRDRLGILGRLPGARLLNDLSIGNKLNIGFGMLVGLTLLVVGLGFLGSRGAIQDIQRTTYLRAPIALASTRAQVNLLRMQTSVRGYLALGDPQYRDDYQGARQAFEANLAELEALLADEGGEDIQHLNELDATFEEWSTLPERLFELHDAARVFEGAEDRRPLEALYLFSTEAEPRSEHMLQMLEEMTAEHQSLLQSDLDRGGQKLAIAQVRSLVAGLLAFILGIGMALLAKVHIVGPIRRLIDTTGQITAGDLSAQANVESADEIGQLATATNTMTGRLRETIDSLSRRTQQLEALRHASLALTSHLNLQDVLKAILEGTLQLVGEAQTACVFLYQAERLTLGAALAPDNGPVPLTVGPGANSLIYTVAQQGQPIAVPDTRLQPRYVDVAPGWEGAIVGLPLESGGRTVGVMAICRQPPAAWRESELSALDLLADQAAVAIENAGLYEQARQEIAERRRVENELRRYRDYLEELVGERTARLKEINQQLTQEIAERVRAESHRDATLEALQQSEERYRAVSELTSDYADALRVEPDGSLTREWVTGAFTRITGFTPDELPARDGWKRIVHPDDFPLFQRRLENLLSGQPDVSKYRIITKSGEVRWLQAHGRPIWDESGDHIVRYIGAAQDITDRMRAEEQLERYAAQLAQSNQELRHFTYIVSHDLRAPLLNLKGFAAELRSAMELTGPAIKVALPYLAEEQQRAAITALEQDIPEALGFIDSSVTRMDRFINALLQLSRLGRRQLDLEPIDMQALVQAILGSLAHQVEERGAQVIVGSLPQVVADRTSMEQIVGNLLDNAVKYLDPGRPGVIEITAALDGAETAFQVRDNGRGIAPEDMDKIFAPFRRAGQQDVPGEGMGLPYVQALVRLHGGRIVCESELGIGTTFAFTIPNHNRPA
jgi:PAS domain S-box-containing protein